MMETLKDSELVWRFQNFFGVEKVTHKSQSLHFRSHNHQHHHYHHDHPHDHQVAQVKGGSGTNWIAVDAKEMPKQLLRKEDTKGGGGTTKEDNKGGGGRLRKRVKSGECRKEHNDNKDREVDEDEALESSGYSSGEKDEPNVIYFKVILLCLLLLTSLSSCHHQPHLSDQQHFLAFTLLDRQPAG